MQEDLKGCRRLGGMEKKGKISVSGLRTKYDWLSWEKIKSGTVLFAPLFGCSTLPTVMGAIRIEAIGIDGVGIWDEVSAMAVVKLQVLLFIWR